MNRAERRKKAREFNTPNKLDMLGKQLEKYIRKEYEENAEKRMVEFIRGYTTVVIYVLWYSFGMGKKRIARFKDELDKHLDILEDDKKYELTLQDMTKMLREEADIDLQFIDDGKKIDRRGK